MAKARPIPTPLSQHCRRVRYQLFPVLVFLTAATAAVWLWGQHAGLANAVGEAEVSRLDLTAPADGLLLPVDAVFERLSRAADSNSPLDRQWQMFDKVTKGQLLVKMDDTRVVAALKTISKQADQLQKQLKAKEAEMRMELADFAADNADRKNDAVLQLRRLAMDIADLRLEILDREADIETDKLELQRQNERYDAIDKLVKSGGETPSRLWDVRLRRDVVTKRLEGTQKALAEARRQLEEARKRDEILHKTLVVPETQPAELEVFLAPIKAAISVEEARMAELRLQVDSLEIRAPFDGMIREIFRFPGQTVRMGEQILTLVADESPHVITYVREHHRIGPYVGMRVDMRVRTLPVRRVEGRVTQIGPQVVRVPRQHLRNPDTPEWGLPVRIALPRSAGIRPGELVDITFHREPGNGM